MGSSSFVPASNATCSNCASSLTKLKMVLPGQEDLVRLPGWGQKKVQPIMKTLNESRAHLSLEQLLQVCSYEIWMFPSFNSPHRIAVWLVAV